MHLVLTVETIVSVMWSMRTEVGFKPTLFIALSKRLAENDGGVVVGSIEFAAPDQPAMRSLLLAEEDLLRSSLIVFTCD